MPTNATFIHELREFLAADESVVITEATTFDELDMDSLDKVEVVMLAEDVYGVEINDDDADTLLTVGQMIDFCNRAKG